MDENNPRITRPALDDSEDIRLEREDRVTEIIDRAHRHRAKERERTRDRRRQDDQAKPPKN